MRVLVKKHRIGDHPFLKRTEEAAAKEAEEKADPGVIRLFEQAPLPGDEIFFDGKPHVVWRRAWNERVDKLDAEQDYDLTIFLRPSFYADAT